MPEILVLPSLATRATYPLHLRIVCALVARLADLQISMQHAHTARLVRDFPKKHPPLERMQVQRNGDQIKVVDILACTRSHPHENMNEHCQALTTETRIRSEAQRAAMAQNPHRPEYDGLQLMNLHKAEGLKNFNTLHSLIRVQQDSGLDQAAALATELEKDFIKMRAEVSQLMEEALSTEDLSSKNKENPNA